MNYLKIFKREYSEYFFFLANNKQAVDFKINPSFRTLRLLSAKVFPVDEISVIISEEPMKG